ncbi:MAG: HAMP domain-containing sensor histidine kinase, partial [Coleofasciculaceae cyanobacterium]
QMGFGFRGQSDNALIIAAAQDYLAQNSLEPSVKKQVQQILQNEVQARKIEYATLVGQDLRIIANANTERSGEVFNPDNLVSEVLNKGRQIKSSELVSSKELARELGRLQTKDNSEYALIRYVVTPVRNLQNQEIIGALVAGDIVNNKLSIVSDSILALGGGYSAIYLLQPDGEFALAVSDQHIDEQDNWQHQYHEHTHHEKVFLPNQTILKEAVASEKTVSQRMQLDVISYTIAARALDNYGETPVAVIVRGTPEKTLNQLIKDSLQLQILVSLLALAADVLLAILLGRAISRPIRHLQRTTQEFATGNLAVRAEVFSADETGQLAVTFNQMADRILAALRQEQASVAEQARLNEQLQAEIAQRQQAEVELLKALAKEQELNQLKSSFVNTTSHEFRTPLTTIMAAAELLESYSDRWNKEKRTVYFQRIISNVQHLTQLLDEVLIIGKAEAGKLSCQPAPLDVAELCHSLVEEFQLGIGKQHNIVFSSQGEYHQAEMDKKLLRHILSNLLSNAIKYSPQGSTVNFKITCQEQKVIFQVQDQGIGIPEKDQESLFEMFHRGGNVGNISGTGLGLAIVKKSVDSHCGEVTLNSERGKGTTFTVTIPSKSTSTKLESFGNCT